MKTMKTDRKIGRMRRDPKSIVKHSTNMDIRRIANSRRS